MTGDERNNAGNKRSRIRKTMGREVKRTMNLNASTNIHRKMLNRRQIKQNLVNKMKIKILGRNCCQKIVIESLISFKFTIIK